MGHNFSILIDRKSKNAPANKSFICILAGSGKTAVMSKHETTPLAEFFLLAGHPTLPTGIVSFCTVRLPGKLQFCMEALFEPIRVT